MSKPYGSTPALWQLFKAMWQEGHELCIIPYNGRPVETLWWRTFPNPNYYKGVLLEKILRITKHSYGKKNFPLIPTFARIFAKPNLEKLIGRILSKEGDVQSILLINIPLNQIKGLATNIKRNHRNIPVLVYDIDVPTSLPSIGGFTFNHYINADLSEYDRFIIPSEGSVNELRELGALDVDVVHFGVDPELYTPLQSEQNIDIFFYGNGSRDRESNIKMLISEPSKALKYKFLVSGRYLTSDLGNAVITPPYAFTVWLRHCSGSKINLNVVRETHANVFGTSTSRPFELAAMQSCIVSSPYKGIEKWFDIGKEIMISNSTKESIELYQMLIENDDLRIKMGHAARERVLKEHTSRHRAKQIIDILMKTPT